MQDYRIYFLDEGGHIFFAVDLQCEDDEQAKEKAFSQFIDCRALELWQGKRFVVRYANQK